jgi:chloramphenicol 3-O phosphotransferase
MIRTWSPKVTPVIVVLNGASSAGKTTLARAIQDRWTEPALLWGIDTVVGALPKRYLGRLWSTEVFAYSYAPDGTITAIKPGRYGDQVVRGLHDAVAALAREGLHVIVDHVVLSPDWGTDLRSACAGLPLLCVHVTCPVDELDRRERARGDRTLGQARVQHAAVAAALDHDLTVDTSRADPAACAEQVVTQVRLNSRPSAPTV